MLHKAYYKLKKNLVKNFEFKTLKQRLVFWLLFISIIPLLASFIVVFYQRKEYIVTQEIETLEAIRDLKIWEINSWIDNIIRSISTLASDNEIIALEPYLLGDSPSANKRIDYETIRQIFINYCINFDSFKEIFLVNAATKKVEIGSGNTIVGTFCGKERYFKSVLLSKKYDTEDFHRNKTTDQVEMMVAVPVFDKSQTRIFAVIVLIIDPHSSLYSLMLNRTGMGKTGETLIVNKDAVALNELRHYPNAPLNLKIKAVPAVKASQGLTGTEITTDYRGEDVLAAYSFINKTGWGFVAKVDYSELNESINKLAINFLVLFIGSICGIILLVVLIANSISKPVIELAKTAKQLGEGNLTIRNIITTSDELGLLASSVNEMAYLLESQFKIRNGRQKLAETLISHSDPDDFWKEITHDLVKLTSADTLVCYILDGQSNYYKPQVHIGINREMLSEMDSQALEGELGNVVSAREIIYLQNIDPDLKIVYKTTVAGYMPKELISFPVIVDEQVEAIISLSKLDRFSKESIEIIRQSMILINTSYANLIVNSRTEKLAEALSEYNTKLTEHQLLMQEQNDELQQQRNELLSQSQELHSQNIELEMQSKQVEEANRLKSEFLSNMSHELRAPLNSILALSRVLLMQGIDKLTEEERNYLEIIERNGKSLLQLINSILDLSRIESGKIEFSISRFDINNTIKNVIQNMNNLATEKGLFIQTDLHAKLPILESDEPKIELILRNLLANAIKFTVKGYIKVCSGYKDEVFTVSVEDTGIGIPRDAISYIFDEFRQVDGSSSRKFEGSGLGLAIAYKNAGLLGGNLRVESKHGEGSVFTLTIPIYGKKKIIGENTFHFTPSPLIPKGKSILVVDDEPTISRLISEFLQNEGYHCIECNSGTEAIELAKKYHPFAITLDVLMPDISGFDVLQKIKETPEISNIPVIIVSISKEVDTAYALGAMGYVSKPVNQNSLLAEIKKVALKSTVRIILVADDNEFERKELIKFLEADNYQVIEASNGKECIDRLN
jgi:signal transduction histidine kinase/CheY-like chemotaxis protein/HAMP domain-containing protein